MGGYINIPKLNYSRDHFTLLMNIETVGRGCDSVGRAVASDARSAVRIRSLANFYIGHLFVYCQLKRRKKKKRPGMGLKHKHKNIET